MTSRRATAECVLFTALTLLAGCAKGRAPAPPGRIAAAAPRLPAPALVAPPDQSTLTNYPRTVRFRWSGVPQAATYAIEIDCFQCCVRDKWCSEARGTGYVVPGLKDTAYTFNFWGDQKGRWRVWAVDSHAKAGAKSGWLGFAFRAAVPDNSKPSPFGSPAPRRFH